MKSYKAVVNYLLHELSISLREIMDDACYHKEFIRLFSNIDQFEIAYSKDSLYSRDQRRRQYKNRIEVAVQAPPPPSGASVTIIEVRRMTSKTTTPLSKFGQLPDGLPSHINPNNNSNHSGNAVTVMQIPMPGHGPTMILPG
jgi:hypothetical protein